MIKTIIIVAVVGPVVWFATHFLALPILRFRELKENIHTALIFTANVATRDINPEAFDSASDRLRTLSSELQAFEHALLPHVRWLFSLSGYKLKEAASYPMGLSNMLGDRTTGERARQRWRVEKSLKLPLSYKTEPKTRD